MTRKMVRFEMAALDALELLAVDKHKRFQDLMDEAVVDLLKKYKRPTTTKDMLKQSLGRSRQSGKANS